MVGDVEIQNLSSIRRSALQFIEKSQAYNEAYLVKRCIAAKQYKAGDFVVMRNVDVTPGVRTKLIPKYRGPYVIHKVIGNDVIRDISN